MPASPAPEGHFATLRVNKERLLRDLDDLATIGATAEGGVSRPALSPQDVEARLWFRRRAEADGLQFRADGAGNLSAVLPSERANARTLLLGSHLDTVINGGRFDGSLGVLAALEVARTLREAGIHLPFHLEVISFTDEEGTLAGLMGSRALTGALTAADLDIPRGGQDALLEGMRRIGISDETMLAARRDPETLVGFLEVHIEQGSRLEEAGLAIGIVTAIVGIRSFWVEFSGQAAHAGTAPMHKRADALWGATAFVQRARQLVMEQFTPGVVNCGQMIVKPGAFNIVPGQVAVALQFRHGTEAQLDAMEDGLRALAREAADTFGLTYRLEHVGSHPPAPTDAHMMDVLEQAADRLGLRHTRMISFAGHDTQSLSAVTPSAMFFVPSVNGVSHSPDEFTKPEDVANAANVLLQAVLVLADEWPHSQ